MSFDLENDPILKEALSAREKRKRVWVIAWRNKETGAEGRGAIKYTHGEASAICFDADAVKPKYEHWPERAAKAESEAA